MHSLIRCSDKPSVYLHTHIRVGARADSQGADISERRAAPFAVPRSLVKLADIPWCARSSRFRTLAPDQSLLSSEAIAVMMLCDRGANRSGTAQKLYTTAPRVPAAVAYMRPQDSLSTTCQQQSYTIGAALQSMTPA